MTDLLNLSDEELVKSFVSGNQKCFDVLLERHKQKVFSYIFLMVRKQELAEDIFQDAFLKVYHTIMEGRYAESGRFASWVMRIAHNLIIDHFRRQKHFPMVYNDDHPKDLFNHPRYSDSNIEEQLVFEEVLKDVSELVELLPDNQKEVVKMRHYLGLSFKEIAEETNVSINTALGRMRYALINLRRMMEERQLTLTAS
ncbi:RNA polymerase sigma factor [Geofilum rubicundum]|uniref:RNA polymerase sigma-70 factor, ECF subfamily n=1 Tax=Geofilum rubicundum JCM 15548 TaxID=1236989 RepID=A0A0E9LTS0_9BACT|nr:sigma-70 family RNA polymerase sigma factor [Geofilum rubicundum]GAO28659.1 RNA polymerase sigma-70 factor, ECF subfamily [Geofilum rubicundum JCM 15548]